MRTVLRKLRRDIEIAGYCRRATKGLNYFSAVRRGRRICEEEKFTPREAYLLGLFNGECHAEKFVSRKRLTKLQEGVNPVLWSSFLKDKGVFYRYCNLYGIVVPELYALFFKDVAGWCSGDKVANGKAEWVRYIGEQLADEFVVKPCVGAHGEGLGIFVRQGSGFVDLSGRWHEAAGVWRFLCEISGSAGCVIQQRVRNHHDIERLAGSKYLQSVRVVTFGGGPDGARILHAHLKLTAGDNVADNFGDGLCGNIQCAVDLHSGKLHAAVRFAEDGSGIASVETHPETGVCFEGFELPWWQDSCRLVRQAAKRFAPVRAIGWDVAITDSGPVIIEGNIWWDPHNQHQTMDRIREVLGAKPV